MRKADLTADQLSTLARLARGGPHLVDWDIVEELISLGLAKNLLGGAGITDEGKRLLRFGVTRD